MNCTRYLSPFIKQDLKKKMVFLEGPRQVGKTTLSLTFFKPSNVKNPAYLNWDILRCRKNILRNEIPLQHKTLVFDEIHKYKNWRNLMKGLYDENHSSHSFLVTGSARLDHFSKGGDSLMGRYFYYHLHPFSLLEMNKTPGKKDLEALLKFYGSLAESVEGESSFSTAKGLIWTEDWCFDNFNETIKLTGLPSALGVNGGKGIHAEVPSAKTSVSRSFAGGS